VNTYAGVMGNCCLVTVTLIAPTDHTECLAKWHYRKKVFKHVYSTLVL